MNTINLTFHTNLALKTRGKAVLIIQSFQTVFKSFFAKLEENLLFYQGYTTFASRNLMVIFTGYTGFLLFAGFESAKAGNFVWKSESYRAMDFIKSK